MHYRLTLRSSIFAAQYALYIGIITVASFGLLNGLILTRAFILHRFDLAALDPRYTYPNYRGTNWATAHFREFNHLKTEYRAFVGWRRKSFSGATINVDAVYGIRRSLGHQLDGSVYFLGGSTVWGTGSSDATTLPSQFHVVTSQPVLNLGESGYTTRQSLDMLLNMLSYGHMASAVISYEGVNDVSVHCRQDVAVVPTHYGDRQFNEELLQHAPAKFVSVVRHFFMFFPSALRARALSAAPHAAWFSCSRDVDRRRRVAQNIVDNWKFMQAICRKNGIPFYAVLQPTAFSARSRVEHLPSQDFAMEREFEAVYPLIRDLAQRECAAGDCGAFIDLSFLDFADRYVFIDNSHVSPNGNEMIARALAVGLKMR